MVIGVMKVAIIGLGVVGLSFASVLGSRGFSVFGMDSDLKKIEKEVSLLLPSALSRLRAPVGTVSGNQSPQSIRLITTIITSQATPIVTSAPVVTILGLPLLDPPD